jgi:hypothetical protein
VGGRGGTPKASGIIKGDTALGSQCPSKYSLSEVKPGRGQGKAAEGGTAGGKAGPPATAAAGVDDEDDDDSAAA